MKILLCEDDPFTLVLLREHLELQGYNVVTSSNGWDGLAKIENGNGTVPFDLIVSDIFMPEVSGIMMGNLIKQFYSAKTPIVLISSTDNAAVRNAAKDIGADAFFHKPINIPEFLKCVGKYKEK